MNYKIALETGKDIQDFVNAVSSVPYRVFLEDSDGHKVSAKSMLFASVAKIEWNELHCTCEMDIYSVIQRWVVN